MLWKALLIHSLRKLWFIPFGIDLLKPLQEGGYTPRVPVGRGLGLTSKIFLNFTPGSPLILFFKIFLNFPLLFTRLLLLIFFFFVNTVWVWV